jgi:hypothetical protein
LPSSKAIGELSARYAEKARRGSYVAVTSSHGFVIDSLVEAFQREGIVGKILRLAGSGAAA